jgi:hypothetical protein
MARLVDVISTPAVSAIARVFRRIAGGITPADNNTIGVAFEAENDAGGNRRIATIETVFTDVSDGTEDAELIIKLTAAGAPPTEVWRVGASGAQTFGGSLIDAPLIVRDYTFDETAGVDSTYTATCVVPAGYSVVDIKVGSTVLWDAGTSALLRVGDADSATGYISDKSLKAAGDVAADTSGAWTYDIERAAGTYRSGKYYAAAGLITAKVTTDDDGTHIAGLSRIQIVMVKGETAVAATKAAV